MLLLTYSTAVLCAVFIITGAVSGGEEKKAVGGTVSFRLDTLGSPVTSFTWKQKNGGTVKAIEWDEEDDVSIPNPRFQNITSIDKKTGQITITNLKVEHSGIYTIDINSKEQQQTFTLTVMEPVPKPVITIEKSGNSDVYLRCGYSETIIWKNSTGDTLKGTKNHNPGEFITVENTRNTGNFYTCTFKNDVSEETSDRVYEGKIFGTESDPGLIAGIVIGVLLLLIIIAIILIYLLVKPVHERVNEICPCIPNFFGPLDCLLKKEGEPKDSQPNDAASKPLNETTSP